VTFPFHFPALAEILPSRQAVRVQDGLPGRAGERERADIAHAQHEQDAIGLGRQRRPARRDQRVARGHRRPGASQPVGHSSGGIPGSDGDDGRERGGIEANLFGDSQVRKTRAPKKGERKNDLIPFPDTKTIVLA